MSLKNILRGTGVAVVTPFKKDFTVDYDALSGIIDSLIGGGVNYIVTLGTTGETPTLNTEEQKAIIRFTYEKVNDRVPVVVGIGGNNTQSVIEHLQSYPLDKAVAVLSASPYYSKPSQEGIYQHYKAIAAASPKPIIMYNVPGRTGRNMEPETTIRLAQLPNIAGIKEAGNNMAQGIKLLRDRPVDFLLVSGDDDLAMPQVAIGMDGVISVAANAFPKEFSSMIRLAAEGNISEAKKINNRLFEAYELLFVENNPAGVKAFMHEQGLLENVLRLPLVALSEANHQKVKSFLSR